MAGELVRNVSDTARWVATYRAKESTRKDALFADPLAARLASDRGHAIAQAASKHTEWVIITRTKLIDDLVLECVGDGSERLLDLAAGFDTRPYRLALPSEFRWIEADLPALMAEKEELLQAETAHCRVERRAVDLSDAAERRRFLAEATSGATNVSVLTEGLVMYLDDDVVAGLARDFLAEPAIRHWILDFSSPRIQRDMMKLMGKTLSNAPIRFAPANGVAFFEDLGWKARDIRALFHEAARLKRLPLLYRPFTFFPPANPRNLRNERWTGVVRFERA